jgi:hypothetical protein
MDDLVGEGQEREENSADTEGHRCLPKPPVVGPFPKASEDQHTKLSEGNLTHEEGGRLE